MTYPVPGESYPVQSVSNEWQNPSDRYYYNWYNAPKNQSQVFSTRTDGDLKSEAVDRLRANTFTSDSTLDVNVQAGVVVLEGDVPSAVAKRAAGDDVWDIAGVVDVSNQLRVVPVSV